MSFVAGAEEVFDVDVGEGVDVGAWGLGVGVGGEAELAKPVVDFGGGLGGGGFGAGLFWAGDGGGDDVGEELFAAHGAGVVAAGVEGDGAVVGDHR